jgi:Phage integrase, N-terminal SAM-like domain
MSSPRLLEQVRTVARVKHYSLKTEHAYLNWIKRFIFYHNKQHPKEMGEGEIRQFLAHLAVNLHVSASTQTVALSALLFLYRDVLKIPLPYIEGHDSLSQIPCNASFAFACDEFYGRFFAYRLSFWCRFGVYYWWAPLRLKRLVGG